MSKVLPSIMLAVKSARISGLLPGWEFEIHARNTNCSSTLGPLAAFEFYINKSADVFLGPMCDYVIAPVARYAGYWGIPVLTAGAQVSREESWRRDKVLNKTFFHRRTHLNINRTSIRR